jgi:hypothetical protein
MPNGDALRIAIDLLHVPSRVRSLRLEPLPRGVPLLLQIAAEDPAAIDLGVKITDRPRDVVREAAEFFIEQVLLWQGADSYRVLGASQQSGDAELRSNMANLIKWLHPDSSVQGQQSVFVKRVTLAWDDLKTPGRRAAYDDQWGRETMGRAGDRRTAANVAPKVRYRKSAGRRGLLRSLRYLLRGAPR